MLSALQFVMHLVLFSPGTLWTILDVVSLTTFAATRKGENGVLGLFTTYTVDLLDFFWYGNHSDPLFPAFHPAGSSIMTI